MKKRNNCNFGLTKQQGIVNNVVIQAGLVADMNQNGRFGLLTIGKSGQISLTGIISFLRASFPREIFINWDSLNRRERSSDGGQYG